MSSKLNQPSTQRSFFTCVLACLAGAACCAIVGCQDGPLYALKVANPYYSMKEWKADAAFGVTDHERRAQLSELADTIDRLPEDRQQFWSGHLEKMIDNDENAEMRRLAVRAAGKLNSPSSLAMIEKGLDDDNFKVRMEACQALGSREDEEVSRLLAATIGTETNQDVKHAAMKALTAQSTPTAMDSLKLALADRNPATRDLAMESLRDVTGKDYGEDPEVWIAALNGKTVEERPTRFAERIRGIF
ncbi:MAG: HEAT repeat domain-containing protein [Rubripirellula sp.]